MRSRERRRREAGPLFRAVTAPALTLLRRAPPWNSGNAKSAAPFIEATYLASPTKLHLFLWYIDLLIREGREDRVRELLRTPVEDTLEGTVALRSRLARALTNFGQPEKALKLAY
jgi:hypothetical protein